MDCYKTALKLAEQIAEIPGVSISGHWLFVGERYFAPNIHLADSGSAYFELYCENPADELDDVFDEYIKVRVSNHASAYPESCDSETVISVAPGEYMVEQVLPIVRRWVEKMKQAYPPPLSGKEMTMKTRFECIHFEDPGHGKAIMCKSNDLDLELGAVWWRWPGKEWVATMRDPGCLNATSFKDIAAFLDSLPKEGPKK